MGALRCVDGSVLSVQAVTCRDKAGQPYEITLNLARDSVPFAAVGQRCGYQLSQLAGRIAAARLDPEQAAAWPDPDDRFPTACAGPGAGYLPGEHEYFALRSRDRADLPGTGELRCVLRSSALWLGECMGTGPRQQQGHAPAGQHSPAHHISGQHIPGQASPGQHSPGQHSPGEHGSGQHAQTLHLPGQHAAGQHAGQRAWPSRHPAAGHGTWRLTRRAVIEAWGADGTGVRAVLTSAELVAFLDTVLTEPEGAEPAGAAVTSANGVSGSSAGAGSAGFSSTEGLSTEGLSIGGAPAGGVSAGGFSAVELSAEGGSVRGGFAAGMSASPQSAGKRPGDVPLLWQREGVPDGIARPRLPALRAQARGDSGASGDTSSRRGDV